MSALPTKKQEEESERIRKAWAERAGLASVAIPWPVGDMIGLGADLAVPENRTPLNIGLGLAGLLPGVPNIGNIRRISRAGEAAAKDLGSFDDQMRLARTVMEQQRAAKEARKLDPLFDAKNGIGQVPNNEDIEKLGAVHYMRPSEYLNLAEPLTRPSEKSLEYIRKGITSGKKLGQPTLTVDLVNGVPQVVNHDGRHRTMVIKELFGDDALIPVHVIGRDRSLPKKVPPSLYKPQREQDEYLADLLKRADELLQRKKDKK